MDSDYEDDDEDILYSDDDSDQVDSSKEDSYRSLSSNELFNCMNEIISETGEVIHQVNFYFMFYLFSWLNVIQVATFKVLLVKY